VNPRLRRGGTGRRRPQQGQDGEQPEHGTGRQLPAADGYKHRGGERHQETRAVNAEQLERQDPPAAGKREADAHPGEPQVIQFAAEVFQARPQEGNQDGASAGGKAAKQERASNRNSAT